MALPSRCLRRQLPSTPSTTFSTRASPPLLHQRLRSYHSHEHPAQPPYPPAQTSILSAALTHVPTHGFTSTSLTLGARSAGYVDVSTQLFPRGAFELVAYHLVTRRLALKESVSSLDPAQTDLGQQHHQHHQQQQQYHPQPQRPRQPGVGARVRDLTMARLRHNAPVIHKLPEALALMSLSSNVPASLRELAALSDEIWYLASDAAVDFSWYTKRASLSAVYAAAEVYQTQDQSTEFRDTERFLDSRLEELRTVGGLVGDVGQWVGGTMAGALGVLRSKGVRI
ncbi:hypothetical protein LTS18_006351 [Coniosporium uncinatum]|uniref:Uncharacterized protein n=1 Tax=Coniosporium uncinatum TaxID=93489 RepID=A0ACC3D4A6_9PEZI|nr:hypothetical protein LTS18_006351 [Coniosporium uncinatum]